jgi:hypothetical protein
VIPELEPPSFVGFLAAMWSERGWETSVKERADETHFVIGKRPDGKRGVIYVFPTTTATVTERHLVRFVKFCRKKGIDVAVVATQGAFAEGAERVAAERSVHLLDRSSLAESVEKSGLEDVLDEFTGAGGSAGLVGRLRDLGVPVPDAVDRLPDREELLAMGYGLVPFGGADGDADAGSDEESSPSDDSASPSPSAELAASPEDGRTAGADSSRRWGRPLPLGLIVITLLGAFVLGATVGPAVGLGGTITAGISPVAGPGSGPDVSAISTAGGSNATVDVRWNVRATDSITVNGTTYDAPEGQTLLVVSMNVTNGGEAPVQLPETAIAADVGGTRYGHQPLTGVTGFPGAGLFAPGETRTVWTVFAVPEDAGSVTLVVDDKGEIRFVRDGSITPEATVE